MAIDPKNTRMVNASREQLTLVRDLSQIVHDFLEANQGADSVETISLMGCAAGMFISSAPDPSERLRARDSVVVSLDMAIKDGLAMREAEGEKPRYHS